MDLTPKKSKTAYGKFTQNISPWHDMMESSLRSMDKRSRLVCIPRSLAFRLVTEEPHFLCQVDLRLFETPMLDATVDLDLNAVSSRTGRGQLSKSLYRTMDY